ncbi:major facilitator superfamily MFS_1 [Shewanella denitrificans OS217]|uniref:Major facilitator superfamily MFS_1 n=1 Tax=Shewanella denitrificans (strain OS217 / ATCC BAA-1090 / DSM 15013) TaxID=318161 RepID=Q12MP0_SHEDO|nr:MFS transporter [Shewanella denitrificans]ABE55286.1 major facilitator superfamily MFS_1 [Shewanella denitrificans OS217]
MSTNNPTANTQPQLHFWQIFNMCFGFLGIQFGFALQNANVSRIFQTLGADMDAIPILWIAAPLTGLIVQPIIGYLSDNTWNRFGRRRPYFLIGAVLTTLALFIMPHSPTLWIAAGMLWIMDASINIAMEPFRAFVGDNLPKSQRTQGYAMQSFFIGIGAVVASALPYVLTEFFNVANTAPAGEIADSVRYAFYFGAVVLFMAVTWTVVSTKEYSPAELESFHQAEQAVNPSLDKVNPSQEGESFGRRSAAQYQFGALIFALIGGLFTAAVYLYQLDKQLYILSIGILAFAPMQYYCALALKKAFEASKNLATQGKTTLPTGMLFTVVDDMFAMPKAMRQLALVQFFAWFALFAMWIYTTAAVTSYHYGSSDVLSKQFNDGADWVGILFASYNGFAALAAICIPFLAKWVGVRLTHTVNMFLGGSGLISFYFISDPSLLWLPMIGVGFAWASILSVPYALLSGALPPQKMGVYMGIFNFFIVIPQLLAASILGLLLKTFFNGEPIYALVLGGVFMMLSGIAVLFVDQDNSH